MKISGPDLAMKIYDQAQALGADIRLEEAVAASLSPSVKSIRTAEGDYEGQIGNHRKRRQAPHAGLPWRREAHREGGFLLRHL